MCIMKSIAQTFKALSDETRLRILALLSEGELCVCDLMAALDLPQSTVSRHLAYLRNAGLVDDQRRGIWMFYRLSLADSSLGEDIMALLTTRLSHLEQARQDRKALGGLTDARGKRCG